VLVNPHLGVDLGLDRPHPARVYDYWLGGKDHFAADRAAGDELAAKLPSLPIAARANRGFMVRVVRYLAAEQGVRQFLDIGTGLPVAPNLHEVAQGVAPAARVVYVDNDPLVLVHARALLTGTPQGACDYLDADLRDPAGILDRAAGILEFDRPIAVTLIAILHLFGDDETASILAELTRPLCAGSALVVTVVTGDSDPPNALAASAVARHHGLPVRLRTKTQAQAMLAGLELIDPGVTLVHRWRPHPPDPPLADPPLADHDVHVWGGVGLKSIAGRFPASVSPSPPNRPRPLTRRSYGR
jgi:hypothetical protein